MPKLTVLVPCLNAEALLRECLESVAPVADEILVVDSGSTDRTREIARAFTGRVLVHDYANSAAQKNWAIPQAAHEWVLVIDTDERATSELRRELRALLAGEPAEDGFRILRQNYFFGTPIRHCGWERDDVLRLFRRDRGRYEEKRVHADVLVEGGRVGRLEGRLLHYTYTGFDQYLEKFGRYTTWAAEDLLDAGKRPTAWNLLARPAFRFFRMYVLRRGFLDGIPGLILCTLAAMSVFMKYAKLWAILREKARSAPAGPPSGRGNA
ncbi:MAG: glycosyltransferase family 2 protein [Planctomycetota bacterium]